MDIRNVGTPGNADRVGDRIADRGKRARADRADESVPARAADDAQISATGRETAQAVEQLAERARRDGDEREALVEKARQKLADGELDGAEVFAATAGKLAARGFLSA